MRLSFTASQRLGVGALLVLMLTVCAIAMSATTKTMELARTDLASVQHRKELFTTIAHSFANAGTRFFASLVREEEDSKAVRSELDHLRAALAELRVSSCTSREREAVAHLANSEQRVRTALYAYELGDLGDPTSDSNKNVLQFVKIAVAEATTEAERWQNAAAAACRRKTAEINEALEDARTVLMVGGALATLFALVVSVLLTRALSKPIKRILQVVEELGNGQLDARLNSQDSDIVGRLGRGIDRMGEQIEAHTQSLREEKRQSDAARRVAEDANARAEYASQAKSEFLANMSHEIRTPMTAVLGFAETALDPDLSDSERANAAHTVRHSGEHLLQIINDILDISKIEAGKVTVECIRCSPVQIVAEVNSLMRVRASVKELSYDIEYVGSVPETINTDPTRLRQILVNLSGNAIKFTKTGGVRLVIRLVADGDGPKMQFDVIDTGLGMTDEEVGRLFRAFMQADTSTTRKFGGTGLGLMISKRLAEMLGGDITVESKPGQGSLFRVAVSTGPLDGVNMLDDPAAATIAQPETATATKPGTDKLDCRILLAEDGPDNQRLISFVLKKAGAEVTIVENGKLAFEAALAALNRRREADPERPFDVILMDMQMPVMDGYEATSLLRRKGYTGPIIALTAHAMEGDRQKCIDAGCDEYATKPIDRKKLIETIQQHIHKAHGRPDAVEPTPRKISTSCA